jgi:hypothetical protein
MTDMASWKDIKLQQRRQRRRQQRRPERPRPTTIPHVLVQTLFFFVSIWVSLLSVVVVRGQQQQQQQAVVVRLMQDSTNGTTTTTTNTKADVCGHDNDLVTHTMEITTPVRLEPNDHQIAYFQRHLPPQGKMDLSRILLRNNDDVISPQTVDSVVRVHTNV